MSKYFAFLFLILSFSISSCASFDEITGSPEYDPGAFKDPNGGSAHIYGTLSFISGKKVFSGDYSDIFLVSDNKQARKLINKRTMRDINPHLFDFSRVTTTSDHGAYDFGNVPDGKWYLFSQVTWNDNDPETGPPGTFLHTMMVGSEIEIKDGKSIKLDLSGDTVNPQVLY